MASQAGVLIVGAGPVGLVAHRLLRRWGIESLVVERHDELSPFPRSRLVNVRSMEIFRQLGLDQMVRRRAFGPEFGCVRASTTIADPDFGVAGMRGVIASVPESPAMGAVTSQDRLEPILVGNAPAGLRFGTELVALKESAAAVTATLVDHSSGTSDTVTADFVLATDGANSTVRELTGIGTVGPGPVGRMSTVVFGADLGRWLNARPAGVHFLRDGLLMPLYPEGGWALAATNVADPDSADWPAYVRRGLGIPDLLVEVRRVQHWTINAFVAERFASGRVVLAGDAVHTMSPLGGLGMNTGLVDAHNLGWKLAGVLNGWAGRGLLGTYEAERKPVAEQTTAQATANTTRVLQLVRRGLQGSADAADVAGLPWSDRYFQQSGLVLGYAYESAAVLPDGSSPPIVADPVTDYEQTACPGHRAPHAWLRDDRSTLDLFGEWFTLLSPDPDSYVDELGGRWPVRLEALPEEHRELYGLGVHGAVLVRPDGHIATRWPEPPSPGSVARALNRILCMNESR